MNPRAVEGKQVWRERPQQPPQQGNGCQDEQRAGEQIAVEHHHRLPPAALGHFEHGRLPRRGLVVAIVAVARARKVLIRVDRLGLGDALHQVAELRRRRLGRDAAAEALVELEVLEREAAVPTARPQLMACMLTPSREHRSLPGGRRGELMRDVLHLQCEQRRVGLLAALHLSAQPRDRFLS